MASSKKQLSSLRRFWAALGPGIVTGAADDDPSGIATYSIAGARYGTSLLWTALITWPLMAAVQAMCARIGMVTGRGLMGALHTRFPRPLLVTTAALLLVANTINVGADLAGMGDAAALLTTIDARVWVIAFGVAIAWATFRLRYRVFADALKWLALVLFVYVIAAFKVRPSWSSVVHDTFSVSLPHHRGEWATLVAILGTTISPYLFFWQASEEVEEEKAEGRGSIAARRGATRDELARRRLDVGIGTLFSNVAMYFIILTTALTLHQHGLTALQSSRDVAKALEPLAGGFAATLYTLGIVGTGVLAIPTLGGSAAYAFADIFGWPQGIDRQYRTARAFYAVIALAIAVGVAMNFAGINPITALYWTAVINGVLAPPLLLGILLAASDAKLMQSQPSPRVTRIAVAVATMLMFVAAVAMFVV
jgi:NRAMP (natural resistance-associated macrophage protein)-like metal ion transporter